MLLQVSAFHAPQLMLSCCVVSVATGVLVHATLLQDAELAPPSARGAVLIACVDLSFDLSSLAAAGVVYAVDAASYAQPWMWRLVLGGSVMQAFALVCIVPFLPETPASLVQRGRLDEGLHALRELRGPLVSEAALSDEFGQLLLAAGGGDELRGASSVSCSLLVDCCYCVGVIIPACARQTLPPTHHKKNTTKGRLYLRELRDMLRPEQAPLLALIAVIALLAVRAVCDV